jgi:hypothetical protein
MKINSNCIKDLKIKAKPKILKEKLHDTGLGNDFLDMTPKI